MNTRLLPIISILILATFVLMPGRGLGTGAKRQAVQPAIPQAPAAPAYGITTRVSVASDGSQGNNYSDWPSISADGRYVAFTSRASNLVSGDTNNFCIGDRSTNLSTPPPPENSNCPDVFVHDRGEETVGYAIYLPLT